MQINYDKNTSIIERILIYLDYKGITKYKFCKVIGVSRGFLDKSREISTDKYANILAQYPEINSEWLLTGKGSMVISEKYEDSVTLNESKSAYNKTKKLPLIPLHSVAEIGKKEVSVMSANVEGYYVVPEFNEADFLVRISGDSMMPTYAHGDIAACKRMKEAGILIWGRHYILQTTEQGTLCKRIYPHEKNKNIVILKSDFAEKYPPIEMPKSDITDLFIVMGLIRKE